MGLIATRQMRIRENAESIAFYGGEDNEKRVLKEVRTAHFSSFDLAVLAKSLLNLARSLPWLSGVCPNNTRVKLQLESTPCLSCRAHKTTNARLMPMLVHMYVRGATPALQVRAG